MIYANEMITVDGVTTLTMATLAKAIPSYGRDTKRVICTVETDDIRIRMDDGNPTSSVGHLMAVGDIFYIDGTDVLTFKAIKVTNNAKLAVSYEI